MIFLSNEYKDWERDKIEEEKTWVQKYPFLHIRDIDGTIDTHSKFPMMSLEIPDGWEMLFTQFCDDLKEVLIEEGCLDAFYFIQIKEKYNQLRCYAGHPTTKKILQVLDKYEYLSQFVCTSCGAPATKITTGYIASICDDCWKDKFSHHKIEDIKFSTKFKNVHFGKNTGTIINIIDFTDEWNRYLKSIEVK